MSKRRLLILAYYYPPSNITAANRINAWTKHLPKDKIYPTVITWDWERETGDTEIKKFDGYEVHFVPRKLNRFNRKLKKALKDNSIMKKPLILLQLLLANSWSYITNSESLSNYFSEYLKENTADVVISSGSPFLLHVLVARQKKLYNFYQIADYRDPWSNNKIIYKSGIIFKLIQNIDTHIEKKISKMYDYLLAASDYQRIEICKHNNSPIAQSDTMLNGFEGEPKITAKDNKTTKHIQILFSGSLYPTQLIEDILEVINIKLKDKTLPPDTKIIFLGAAHDSKAVDRINKSIIGFENYYEITPRIEYQQAMKVQLNSDLLVMPSYTGMKGIPSSKLFDYVSTGLPVLLYPNDEDIIEEILKTTKLGLICNTKAEIKQSIDKLVKAKQDGISLVSPELDSINNYSRKEQTKVLEQTIEKLCSKS